MVDTPVIPAPVLREPGAGAPLRLAPGLRVVAGPEPEAVSTAVLIASRINHLMGMQLAVVQEDDGTPGALVLRVATDPADLGLPAGLGPALEREAYRLEVTTDRATITALDGAGLIRGAMTLQQLSRRAGADAAPEVAPVVVVDHPRYAWRGLSLDLARHFFGLGTLKRLVTLMSGLKLNVLHLHLTDDQGWRLQVPSRPALTEASGATAVGGDPGGWLTAEDYAELVTFAASRHVTVIPEVDLPGHVNAALHAYGELTPSGEPARAYTGIDVGFSRLDASLPATATFLHDVLGDVAAMTPGPYVHIGGDEVLTMDRAEYAALVRTAVTEVRGAGKRVVAWQEVASAVVSGDVDADGLVLQYWDERAGAPEMARAAALGADVVLSPASKVYLDMRYDADTPVGLDWAGHVELRDSYVWDPEQVLPDVPAERVLGIEAALWTETVRTEDDLFFLLLPRLAAVAEVAWSAPDRRDWADFAARVPALAARWREAGLRWYASPQVAW